MTYIMPNNSSDGHHRNEALTVALTILFLTLVLATISGNILVCLAVLLVRKLRQPGNYLLVSLALVDCAVGCLVMPFAFANWLQGSWQMGAVMCNIWTCADVTFCTASILNLCAISVDRYWTITRPLVYASVHRTTKRICCYIGLIWVSSLFVSVVPLFFFDKPHVPVSCTVIENVYYQVYATLGSFYIPTVIMLTVNFKIIQAVRKLYRVENAARCGFMISVGPAVPNLPSPPDTPYAANRKRFSTTSFQMPLLNRCTSYGTESQRQHRSWIQHEGKALITLGIIMGAFITCWLPFFILALIKPLCGGSCSVPKWLDDAVLWLGYANSTLNPLIYAKYNRDFRIPFREMLCCRFGTLKSVLRSEMYEHSYGPSAPNGHVPVNVMMRRPTVAGETTL